VTDYGLFQNRVTGNAYEAGSVMKTLTVSSGLDMRAITPTSTSPNPTGCTTVDDATICNVVRNGITQPTTQQLLTYSFNTGAVDVVRKLGGGTINKSARDKLYDYFTNHFRLGTVTGIEQSSEADGVIYSPDDEQGNSVRYANMSFGQGMTTTMIQVAAAFSSAINGGTYYRPTLVYGTQNSDGSINEQSPTVVMSNVVSAETSAEMRDLVWHSRYDNNGKSVDPVGYHIGGKSGTAQTIDPKTGMYTSDLTIGSYLGFVGGSSPKYVIMIRMDFAQGGTFAGSIEANTMYGELARWLIGYTGMTTE
jgi:cell division protein FtsI/penicillin-binding protein 2